MLRSAATVLTNTAQHLWAVVYPDRCAACDQLLMPNRHWCTQCWTALTVARQRQYCPACGTTLGPHHDTRQGRCRFCRDQPAVLDGVCRVGSYESALMLVVKKFKYKQNLRCGEWLAELLADVLSEQEWFEDLDVIVPIPTHWSRRWERGFSHTRLLVERISQESSLPPLPLLGCTRPLVPQAALSARARVNNVKGAFAPAKGWPVKGAVVCLVDDVMTTGATLREAARTLRHAGARQVYGAVVARASLDDVPTAPAPGRVLAEG